MHRASNARIELLAYTALAVSAAAQAGAPCAGWALASEFRVAPQAANPGPDACGNAAVWHFLQSDPATFPAHDVAGYTLLPEFVPSALGIAGLQQWTGSEVVNGPLDKLPAVGLNATGSPQSPLGMQWPAGVVRVHPGSDRFAIVGWRSPVAATVSIEGGVRDLHTGLSDGVLWAVEHFDGASALTLAAGALPDGGAQTFASGASGADLAQVTVEVGDWLYFVIDPAASKDFDSTELELAIAPVIPCGSTSVYCVSAINTTGVGARIGWSGAAQLSANDFVLRASDVPPHRPGVFFFGRFRTQIPFGEGYLCVTGMQQRLRGVLFADSAGQAELALDFADPSAPEASIAAGAEWNFQFWYRDPQPVGHGFNLSDALSARFCP